MTSLCSLYRAEAEMKVEYESTLMLIAHYRWLIDYFMTHFPSTHCASFIGGLWKLQKTADQ